MATVSSSIADFYLSSAWTNKNGGYAVYPNQTTATKSFTVSGISDGGKVTGVSLAVTAGSPLSGIAVLKINGKNAVTGSNTIDLTGLVDGNGTYELTFVFKANGDTSLSDGYHVGSLTLTNIGITVTYTAGTPEPDPDPEIILESEQLVVLFNPKEREFKGNGICVLSPTSCVVTESAGGEYELEMEHPFDQYGKYLLLHEDYIIRSPVPQMSVPQITLPPAAVWKVKTSVNNTPLYSRLPTYTAAKTPIDEVKTHPDEWLWDETKQYIAYNGNVGNSVCIQNGIIYQALRDNISKPPYIYAADGYWEAVATATSNSQDSSASGGVYDPGVVAENLSGGELITKVADYNAYYIQVRSLRGIIGYVSRSACEETANDPEEQIIVARTITNQLFRIYEIHCEDDTRTVTVKARHISYDYQKNSLFDCQINEADPATAIAIIQGSLMNEDHRVIACDIDGIKITGDYSFANPVQALLDPDDGIAAALHAQVIRDNSDFFLLDNSVARKGPDLLYGKNLRGVTWEKNIEELVTRVVPRADDGNGGYVYLDELFVDSPLIDQYGVICISVLDLDYSVGEEIEKADGTKYTLTREDILQKLREAAENVFSVQNLDKPKITLDVQFVLMGDTEQYKQYKGLQHVSLYDVITIKSGPSGLEETTQVIGYEWDCLLKRYNGITVGNIYADSGGSIPGYQLSPGAVTTKALAVGSVSGSALKNNSVSTQALVSGSVTAVQLAADSVLADKIAANAVTAQKIDASAVTTDKLAANAVTAGKIAANAIEAGHLSASAISAIDAEISTANIGYAQIKDASIQSLIARDAVTDRYYIDKLAVRNAQMVQATVGELVIRAADNKYYRLDVAANGSVTPTEVTLTSSEIATGVTSDGHGAIIETDLTVADLSASNMKAVSALIDKLTASRIDVAELFARSATISQLQAVDISGNTSLHLYVQDNTNKTYAQMTDPAAGNAVHDGDIWIQSDGIRTWGDLSALTWGEAAAYKWGDFTAAKQYVRKGGAWALTDDPGSKYTVRSGIDILPLGIEIGGSKYIRMLSGADFQIKAGGTFTVDSGNFSIDANGNVTMAGTVSAADGQIADWAILPGRLKSGDGAGYVALDSDPTHTYAIWAGAEAADTAPFRVARDGTVYAAKIVTETETGGSTQVDLTQFPLWKLWYNVVKSYTSNSITLSNGDTINFNTAAATTLTGSWSGLTFTVEAKDAQNATVATKQETLTRSITPNQSGSTLSLFDSTHKMILSVGATSQQVGPLWTWTVDASGEYAAGVSDGYASGLTAGKNAVAINKGSWSAGRISFTKSEGTPSTEAVALTAGAASWSGNTASVIIYDVQGGGSLNTGITVTVDASARYDAGWNDCLDNCTGYTCYTGTIRQLYDPDRDVYVLAVTNYSTWTLYSIPNRK